MKKDNQRDADKHHKRYKKPFKFSEVAIGVGIIVTLIAAVYSAYSVTAPAKGDLSYTVFKDMVSKGEVVSASVVDSQSTFNIKDIDGNEYSILNPKYDEFKKDLLEAGVQLDVRTRTADEAITSLVSSLPVMILSFIFISFLLRSLTGQAVTLFKVLKPEDIITFDDVAGMSETKEEVKFAVSQIKNRAQLEKLGARPCKGIILEGPPGTGKTLLAKAIAGEAGVPFISTSGSDFIEMFVGLGAARVRSLWDLALTNAPCVIFIDEIDAVGRRRTGAGDGASVESNQTLNALLQKMDGLGVGSGIFVVAATNRISDLDHALLRPGRFDKQLYVGPPKTKKDRDEVIKVHMRKKSFIDGFDFDAASKLMFGLSGAEIEQVLNEAVLLSVQDNRDGVVSVSDIDKASMKLRSSGVEIKHSSGKDREVAAIHEAGHAIVSMLLGRKVSKVSIIPYSSGVGGMTVADIDVYEDRRLKTKSELLREIKILLSGRMAEQVVLGETSIGCSNDLEVATQLGYEIINSFGMSGEQLAVPSALSRLGIKFETSKTLSDINSLLGTCNKEVEELCKSNIDKLKSLSERLLKEETILDFSEWA